MSAHIPSSPSFASLSTAHCASPDDSNEQLATPKVRFDHECVLIPDPSPVSKLPRLVTKSYSLPLWKRKREPSREPSVDSEDDLPDDHVVFKVSVPSITTKARSPSRDSAHRPLVSCLVHQGPTSPSSPHSRPGRPRGASLPQPPISADVVTVPLRACCSQCYPSIDECMKKGDHYEVHFSRGALRRRKSVSDAHTPVRARHCVRDAMPGFDSIIAVDEVDHRRMSQDMDILTAFTREMPTARATSAAGVEEIPLRRAHSLPDAIYPHHAKLIPDLHPSALSPPIQEEDEFRPSPRRTPISSPLGSSTNLCAVHAMHAVVAEKAHPAAPATGASSLEAVPRRVIPDATLRTSPGPLTPPPTSSAEDSYFVAVHELSLTDSSPCTSPSSSPEMGHARPSVLDSPTGTRKKNLMHLPGNIFRASTSVLKGMSGMGGGMAMSL